eukprot:4626164-Pyramimonas_sp.AAC.1
MDEAHRVLALNQAKAWSAIRTLVDDTVARSEGGGADVVSQMSGLADLFALPFADQELPISSKTNL